MKGIPKVLKAQVSVKASEASAKPNLNSKRQTTEHTSCTPPDDEMSEQDESASRDDTGVQDTPTTVGAQHTEGEGTHPP